MANDLNPPLQSLCEAPLRSEGGNRVSPLVGEVHNAKEGCGKVAEGIQWAKSAQTIENR